MRCEQAREGLSARLDGEAPGVPTAALEAHVASCAACRAWPELVADAARPLRVQPALPGRDLVEAVQSALKDTAAALPARRWARVALVAVAVAHLLLSLPALIAGDGHGAVHVARELGATDVALAVGVLAAAWRPWRAAGMLPVVAALALGLGATSVLDLLAGETTALAELPHLLAVIEAALLFRLRRAALTSPPAAPRGVTLRRVA